MKRPRPILFLLAALAVAGVLRTTTAVFTHAEGGRDEGSAFVSAARAAPATGEELPAQLPPRPLADQLCETPEAMLQALQEERDLLEAQKEQMSERRSEIELASEKLDIDQARLADLKSALDEMLNQVRQAQSDDLDRLVALYSAMKPKEAASIMNDLDIEVSVMVLGTMPERDAAPILARLNPVRARAISRIILERSKLPGDQRLEGLKL
ncbi:MotE family protein [Pseudooceanicola sp.]